MDRFALKTSHISTVWLWKAKLVSDPTSDNSVTLGNFLQHTCWRTLVQVGLVYLKRKIHPILISTNAYNYVKGEVFSRNLKAKSLKMTVLRCMQDPKAYRIQPS